MEGLQKKRPAMELSNGGDDEHSTKRPRRQDKTPSDNHSHNHNPAINFVPIVGKKFLRLHLQILKAVYEDPLHDGDDDPSSDHAASAAASSASALEEEDGKVDASLWDTIQSFLKHRQQVRTMADQVKYYQGVHDEAIEFKKEEKATEDDMVGLSSTPYRQAPNIFCSRATTTSSLLLLSTSSQASPHPPRFSNSLLSGPDNDALSESNSAFGLIAGLLQQKYLAAFQNLRQTTDPFRPLLQDVTSRVATLERKSFRQHDTTTTTTTTTAINMDHSNDNNSSSKSLPTQLPDEMNEEYLARMETKLRLWKMLQADLICSSQC